jgi:two-component system, OmpR family, sensor histidine kinase VicK
MTTHPLKSELLNAQRTLGWMDMVLASISDAVCVVDDKFVIIFANDAFARMFSKQRIFLLGQKFDQITHLSSGSSPLTKRLNAESNLISNAEALNGEYEYRSKGSLAALRITAQSIPTLRQAVIMMHDVTKERALERMKNEFVSLASHQLRTPISVATIYGQLLQDSLEDDLDKTQLSYLDNIQTATQHMNILVDNLLDVSRLSNKHKLRAQKTSLQKIIQKILLDLEPRLNEKHLGLTFDVPRELPDIVSNPIQVREVFSNLIVNGIQYSLPSGKITVTVDRKDDAIVTSIQDEGIGIPKASHKKLFLPFYRAPNATEHFTHGTGLGLYVVERMIDELSGKIWFESEQDKGTTFFVSLPIKSKKGRTAHQKDAASLAA